MRVQDNGYYVAAAPAAGTPRNLAWYGNLIAQRAAAFGELAPSGLTPGSARSEMYNGMA
jgi:hypothetical protein